MNLNRENVIRCCSSFPFDEIYIRFESVYVWVILFIRSFDFLSNKIFSIFSYSTKNGLVLKQNKTKEKHNNVNHFIKSTYDIGFLLLFFFFCIRKTYSFFLRWLFDFFILFSLFFYFHFEVDKLVNLIA